MNWIIQDFKGYNWIPKGEFLEVLRTGKDSYLIGVKVTSRLVKVVWSDFEEQAIPKTWFKPQGKVKPDFTKVSIIASGQTLQLGTYEVSAEALVEPEPQAKPERLTVICQEWLETERGWGQRPDGASLHLTTKDKDDFIKDYWAKMPDYTPDEYSRPCGEAKIIEVDGALADSIRATERGLWILQRDYSELVNK